MPTNLPTASAVPTYLNLSEEDGPTESDELLKDLEDRAHARYTLLSSDAMRAFVDIYGRSNNHLAEFDKVLDRAKAEYPSEDGWLVLNLSRIESLLGENKEGSEVVEESVNPTGSLAEAILAGNMNASLALIENRPMVSLANATAELDAAYRYKHGQAPTGLPLSHMLKDKADELSVEKLERVIKALTSAIDGTYSNEKSAVKTAVLKAISVILNR